MTAALRSERGAATAETAIVLVVVSALLILIASVGSILVDSARLHSAARTAAREAIRTDDAAAAVAAGQQVAGPGAAVTVSRQGDLVVVRVQKTRQLAGGLLHGAQFTLHAEATGRIEPHLIRGGP